MAQAQQQPGTGSTQDAADPPQLLRQVFLSYTGQDIGARIFAESLLAPALQAAGLKVFMDSRDLPLGSPWQDLLVEAACRSAVTIVVLSKAYTGRFWCMLELDLALHGSPQHPRQQQPLVIPVFVDDPSSMESVQELQQRWGQPEMVQGMVPPDRQPWVHPERWADNIADVCERFQSHHLSAFSAFGMSRDGERRLAQQVVAAAAPAIALPVHVDASMIGYEEQLSYLKSLLAVGDPALRDVVGLWLYGPGGIGKTRMAMLLYNQLKSRFTHTAVVKLEATDSGNMLLERLFGLLTDLEFQGVEPPAEPHDDITQLQSQLHTFVQGKSVLLLVDNVCSAQQLDALLPPVSCFGPGSRVIITSRLASMPDSDQYKDLSGQILRHYEVQLLQLDHARQLFRYWQRTPPVGHPRELQVLEDAILEACAGRPLAVKNTGSQLQNVSLPSQWQHVLQDALEDLDRAEPPGAQSAQQKAAARGGVDDRPVDKDALGVESMARGTAQYLLHEDTRATTLVVYGSWGSGKSTFMKLVEAHMLRACAEQQLQAMEAGSSTASATAVRQAYDRLTGGHRESSQPVVPSSKHSDGPTGSWLIWWRQLGQQKQQLATSMQHDAQQRASRERMQALASPLLLTVWFNSWQYLTQQEVWSGLVVEVTKQLEDRLSMTHRCCMLWWWWRHICDPCAWFLLCCWPMKLCAACTYNCKTRGWQVVLRCLLPLLLVLALIGVGMGVGIWELLDIEKRKQDGAPSPSPAPRLNTTGAAANTSESAWAKKPVNKGAVAAVAVMGVVTSLFAMLVGGLKHCKDISDSIESGASYVGFKDHRDKLGYQSQVLKDLNLLRELLRSNLARFHRSSGKDLRIVVFIDDIDRCKPSSIIEVLEAVNVVLADSGIAVVIGMVRGIAVVIGMDKDFVLSGIQNAYKDVKVMPSLPKAQEFLQKIVQAELTLPKPAHKDVVTYLKAQGVVLAAAGVELLQDVAGPDPFAADPMQPPQQEPAPARDPAAGPAAAGPSGPATGQQPGGEQQADQQPPGTIMAARQLAVVRAARKVAKEAKDTAQGAASVVAQLNPYSRDAAEANAAAKVAASCHHAVEKAYDQMKTAAYPDAPAPAAAGRAAAAAVDSGPDAIPAGAAAADDGTTVFASASGGDGTAAGAANGTGVSGGAAALAKVNNRAVPADVSIAVGTAELDAKLAQAAAAKAVGLENAAVARAEGKAPPLSAAASQLFLWLQHRQLLKDTTPRELKRLLNRFLLARLCCEEQKDFVFAEEQLLSWVFLWWRFPLGMSEAFKKFKPGDISGPADLAQLLDLQWKKDAAAKQPAAVAGDGAAVDEPPVATATAAAGVASAAQWWRFPYSMSEAFNKGKKEQPVAVAGEVAALEEPPASTATTAAAVARDRLSAAQDDLKKAKDAADAAAVATSDNAAELRKAADKKVEAASLQEELAKIGVLCHDDAATIPLGKLFNLPLSAMVRFRPFGM